MHEGDPFIGWLLAAGVCILSPIVVVLFVVIVAKMIGKEDDTRMPPKDWSA